MELQYIGANCVRVTTKKTQLIIDPASDITTLKPDLKKVNVVLATQDRFLPKDMQDVFAIDSPGEYEFSDVSVKGIAVQPHTSASGDMSCTLYRVSTDETNLLIIGNINGKFSENQLEEIGVTDIVVIPVGGSGYTLDAVEAASIIRDIEPKVVVPVLYAQDGSHYEVPVQSLEVFTKELGVSAEEPKDRLKVKQIPEQLSVQPLTKQS